MELTKEEIESNLDAYRHAMETGSVEGIEYNYPKIDGWLPKPTTSFNIESFYRIKKPTAEDYLKGHKESGLKVGDRVKITGGANVFEKGWQEPSQAISHRSRVGYIGVITYDRNSCGFDVKLSSVTVGAPYFVLEKVEPEYRPWTPEEAIGMVVNLKGSDIKQLITSSGPHYCFLGSDAYSYKALLAEFTRLDGSPCGVEITEEEES